MVRPSPPEVTSTTYTFILILGIVALADSCSLSQPNFLRLRGLLKQRYSCLRETCEPGSSTSKRDGVPTATEQTTSGPNLRCRFSDTGRHARDRYGIVRSLAFIERPPHHSTFLRSLYNPLRSVNNRIAKSEKMS